MLNFGWMNKHIKVHSYTEASFNVEKSRMFKFDNTGENPLYRHVYASYNDMVSLNKGNPSKLAYDLLLRYIGTITLRFKFDELSINQSNRVILYSGNGTSQKFKLYINSNNILCLEESGGVVNEIGTILPDVWHFLALRFNGAGVTIDIDDTTFRKYTIINLNNTYTYVGCSVDSNLKPIEHLNGCIEMLAFKNVFVSDNTINNIKNNGESFSVRTYYDELGRTSNKKIHSKNNVLSKRFTYANKNGLTSTKIASEETYNGESIYYGYDSVGNISNVVLDDNNGNVINKYYTYDGLSRLKTSNKNGVINTYEYDSNNNIIRKNNVTYSYNGLLKDQLTSRSDGTLITYDTTGFIGNPIHIIKPNQNLSLSWSGRRLSRVSDIVSHNVLNFEYDASGIRTIKEVENQYEEKYFLDDDNVALLKRTTQDSTKVLSFIYDETKMLVGFTYNGNEYFYDRTVTGEIRHIIDKTGRVLVSYEYDDWGMPTYVSDGSTIGNELMELNPFMYKGYFYDKEIKMYYLKSRYYDPDLGRFINADAEVGSVGETMGMNLYAYCKCLPVCYSDENGNWPSWATKVCIGLAVIAVCGIAAVACVCTGGSACVAVTMLVGAIKGALIGAVSGAITGGVIGAVTEGIKTGTWEGALKGAISGAIDGAADGFMWGAIGGAISGAMNPKFCFVAGTLVMTKQGLKAIEDIKVGDQVLSYNDNLEIFEYKDVVEVYNNQTTELCHVNTENEEIICTPNHHILTSNGWKKTNELTSGDYIKTSNGFEIVLSIELEQLNEKIDVYNLNVLSYHTYVVGNKLFVVHNSNCAPKEKGVYELTFDDKSKYIGKGSKQRMQQSIKRLTGRRQRNLVSSRFTPCTSNESALMLEHIKMMEAGFGGKKCALLNIIHSPGMKLVMIYL